MMVKNEGQKMIDMARYGVGKGPLCHMCVPVSLCFARADFSKDIVNIFRFLWFTCFYNDCCNMQW